VGFLAASEGFGKINPKYGDYSSPNMYFFRDIVIALAR
jgi:hypothetical protein